MNDKQKFDLFFNRTLEHIHRVHNNANFLIVNHSDNLEFSFEDCASFMREVLNHDRSKYSPEQFHDYVKMTYHYDCKRKGIEHFLTVEDNVSIQRAVENHYDNENHHPEQFRNGIGKFNKFDALETVCDLQAMAQEFNEGTCRKYFENVWKPKQAKYFYDDFNWIETITWMNKAIECFEKQ